MLFRNSRHNDAANRVQGHVQQPYCECDVDDLYIHLDEPCRHDDRHSIGNGHDHGRYNPYDDSLDEAADPDIMDNYDSTDKLDTFDDLDTFEYNIMDNLGSMDDYDIMDDDL